VPLPLQTAAVRARCERTAVERCQARFAKRSDFRSVMPILSIGVSWGRAIGWVCKPKVTGRSRYAPLGNPAGNGGVFLLPNLQLVQSARLWYMTGEIGRQAATAGNGGDSRRAGAVEVVALEWCCPMLRVATSTQPGRPGCAVHRLSSSGGVGVAGFPEHTAEAFPGRPPLPLVRYFTAL
jgi:hypothetical protein